MGTFGRLKSRRASGARANVKRLASGSKRSERRERLVLRAFCDKRSDVKNSFLSERVVVVKTVWLLVLKDSGLLVRQQSDRCTSS